VIYIYLKGHPRKRGCVDRSAPMYGNEEVILDFNKTGRMIGIELLGEYEISILDDGSGMQLKPKTKGKK
jgi:uncharacterized protein YuzE